MLHERSLTIISFLVVISLIAHSGGLSASVGGDMIIDLGLIVAAGVADCRRLGRSTGLATLWSYVSMSMSMLARERFTGSSSHSRCRPISASFIASGDLLTAFSN